MRLGAYDYITKPWDLEEVRSAVNRCVEKSDLARENRLMRQALDASVEVEILGSSEPMRELRDLIRRVAAHDSVVLIQGESGTGKELVARSIHALSSRRRERFVAIACGSIPFELVESELFGHEKGAFSSAYAARTGKFEYASGGTVLLDDVAALPMMVQAKLLRVLQEREICRLGSNRVIPVDVRVISSTNVDLMDLVKKGQFREDLYWRLSGVPVRVPALRDRGDDCVELFRHYTEVLAQRYHKDAPPVQEAVLEALRRHQFPGNVRELIHLAETLFILAGEREISATALPVELLLSSENGPLQELPLKRAVREFERQAIVRALRQTGGNQSKAALLLGIHRNTLQMKLTELGIDPKAN
jgi:DNA-binding NtrC family response regulator